MRIITWLCLLFVAAVIGIFGVMSIGANQFGPMFTGYACLSIASTIIIILLVDAVEQIVNAISDQITDERHDDDYPWDV